MYLIQLCRKAIYNSASADEVFDPSASFFVAGAELRLA